VWCSESEVAARRSDSGGDAVGFEPALSGWPLRRGCAAPWQPGREWHGAWHQVETGF
jgi:hypothetical protein